MCTVKNSELIKAIRLSSPVPEPTEDGRMLTLETAFLSFEGEGLFD